MLHIPNDILSLSLPLSLPPPPLFLKVLSFQSPVIIPPDNREHSVLVLKFTMQSSECFFNTTLRLSTNISFVSIPLQCYDGRLDVRMDR